MIDKSQLIQIVLPPIPEAVAGEFSLHSVAGMDAIANQIEKDLDTYAIQAFGSEQRRTHLGASVIGHDCSRYSWFIFRWMVFESHEPHTLRLFNRGHLEEDRIIQWMTGIGFSIEQVTAEGRQFTIASVNGHFGGSQDGATLLPQRYGIHSGKILVEFKTANAKQFAGIKNSGVRKAKSRYWSQMCIYGFKQQIKYVLYICVGKNDDDLDVELLALDWSQAEVDLKKAESVINSYNPPVRISETASYYQCSYCPCKSVCFFKGEPERNCRSCQFAQPVENAEWKCHKFNNIIPKDFIPKGCDQWQSLLPR